MLNLHEVHLVFLALWGGIVLSESVIELIPFKIPNFREYSVQVHYWIDLFFELPILVAVIITGILLAKEIGFNLHIVFKMVFGSVAVFANLLCVVIVMRRRKLQFGIAHLDAVAAASNQMVWIAIVGAGFAILSALMGLRVL